MAILETENLKKIYGSGAGEVRALDGINMSVETGEFVAVVGSSGSGKSTLLHMLGGVWTGRHPAKCSWTTETYSR